jgi:hypothetical protein
MRRLPAPVLVLLLAAVALGACGDDDADGQGAGTSSTSSTSDPTVREDCTAAVLETPPPDPDLPTPVQETRAEMVEAALSCDYDRLATIGTEGGTDFTVSFGGEDDPAAFWRGLEAEGEPVMATVVKLLDMPWGTRQTDGATQYVWPAAFSYDTWAQIPEGEREALEAVYSAEELEQFAAAGSYIGWRVGITAEGDWIFFVAGD